MLRRREFEASIKDEEHHGRTAVIAPTDKLKDLPLPRKRLRIKSGENCGEKDKGAI